MGKGDSLTTLRKKGENLLNQRIMLGDTSGKVRSVKERDVFALASKTFEFTLLFEASEKKKVFQKIKKKNKSYGDLRCYQIMHAVRLYYALKEYLNAKVPSFYICPEGFEVRWIKYYLKQFLGSLYHDKKINIPKEGLTPMFTQRHIAHVLAGELRAKKGRKPTRELKEIHFKKLGII